MNLKESVLACFLTMVVSMPLLGQVNQGASKPQQNQPGRPGPQGGQPRVAVETNETYDPMRFYRQNPELMQRYFPHLFRQDGNYTHQDPNREATREQAHVLDYFVFKGGTAQDLAQTLKKQFQPTPNIIIPPKLKDTAIPEFELQNVTLADMFQALNNLSEDKSVQWQLSGSSQPIWVLKPVGSGGVGLAAPPQRYGSGGIDPLTGMPLGGRTCQILPVGKYLKNYKIEDITTAVKTAWSMMDDELGQTRTGAEMKYHTDTKLLIVVGDPEQLNILTQVLASLEVNPDGDPQTGDGPLPKSQPSGK